MGLATLQADVDEMPLGQLAMGTVVFPTIRTL